MGSFLSTLWTWINDASMIIAQQRCIVCGRRLHTRQEQICLSCFNQLPFTNIHGEKGNKMERLFWGQIPIVRANAYIYYHPHAEDTSIFMDLKYRNRPQIGIIFGRLMAGDLMDTDFFKDIDVVVPIPLAKERLRQRGYNQSEMLAKGVCEITHLPLDTQSVLRTVSNPTQTRLNAQERKANVSHIFTLSPHHQLAHKHILLIDDILTTGATLISCAQEIAKAEEVCISVLTLGLAGSHFSIERGL